MGGGEDTITVKSDIDTEGFSKGCEKLSDAIKSLEKTVEGTFDRIQKFIDNVDWSAFSENIKGGDFASAAKNISDAISQMRESVKENGNEDVKPKWIDSLKARVNEFVGNVREKAGKIKEVFSTIGKAVSVPFKGIIDIVGKVGNAVSRSIRPIVNAFNRIGNVVGRVRGLFTRSASSVTGMLGPLRRIAPLLLGVGSAYQVISKAVRAYMAQNEELSAKMSSIWTALGNVIGPIVEKICNWILTAVSYFLSFLKILGVTSKSASQLSKNVKNAGNEMKKTIAGFDELNILQDNSSGNDKGGLEDKEAPDWIKDIADFLKKGEWEKAGEALANKLNEMVDSVDWEGIGNKIGYYLNGALTFLESAIYGFNWHNLGEKLATSFNQVLEAVNWENFGRLIVAKFYAIFSLVTGFLENLDYKQLSNAISNILIGALNGIADALSNADGQKIGAGIRTFFENIDWHGVGDAVGKLLKEAWDFAIELLWGLLSGDSKQKPPLVKSLEDLGASIVKFWNDAKPKLEQLWKKYLEPFVKWLANSSLPTLIDRISHGISMLGDVISGNMTIGEFFSNVGKDILEFGNNIARGIGELDFGEIAQNLWNGFSGLISGIDWSGLAASAVEFLGTALGAGFGNMAEFFGTILMNLWSSAKEGWASVKDSFIQETEAAGGNVIAGFLNGVANAVLKIGEWIKKNIVDPFLKGFKDGFDMHSPSKIMEGYGDNVIAGFLNGIKTAWKGITDFLNPEIEKVKKAVEEGWSGLKEKTSKNWGEIKEKISTTWENIKRTVTTSSGAVEKTTGTSWDSVERNINSKMSNVTSDVNSSWSQIASKVKSMNAQISTDNSQNWNSIKTTMSSIMSNLKNLTTNALETMKSAVARSMDNMKSSSNSSMSQMSSTISSSWNNMRGIVSSASQDIFNVAASNFQSLAYSAYSWGSDLCSNIANGIYSAYSWVASAVSDVANMIYSYLHFSEPDKGPLANFHTFMPDMMKMMASGIKDNTHLASDAAAGVADAISEEIQDGNYKFGMEASSSVGDFMDSFSETILDGFNELITKLEEITGRIDFVMPTVAQGNFAPYGIGSQIGETDVSGQNVDSLIRQNSEIMDLLRRILDAVREGKIIAVDKYRFGELLVKTFEAESRARGDIIL